MLKLILILCLALFSQLSLAKVDPSIEWKKIETAHFEVIFNAKHTELGKRYAEYAELAYQYLIPIFKEAPEKTALIINDSTDQANGYATYLPYPHIMIYPTLPLPDMTISNFDYWGLDLVIHEYTHILTFWPTHGLYTPLKLLFGHLIKPMALNPRWYMEGLAVAMETRFSTQGRLRSSDTQAAIKAYIQDKKIHSMTIDRINAGDNSWPYGRSPYLFGALIWQKAIAEKGEDVIYKLLQEGSRKFPFTVNGAFKTFYESSLQEFLTELYLESEDKFKPIKTNEVPLKMKADHRIIDMAISPDGQKMISLQNNVDLGTRIYLHTRDENTDFDLSDGEVLIRTNKTERIGWYSDSNTIYYDKIDIERERYLTTFKIYTYDIKNEKEQLVSKTARDFQPHLSPDDKSFAYIKNSSAQNSLYISNQDGSDERLLYKPDLEVRLTDPTFIDNNELIFSERDYNGKQTLFTLNIETQVKSKIETLDHTIFKIRKSGQKFIFASENNKTKNLFFSEPPFTNFQAITETNTSINNGVWDPLAEKLYISQLTAEGNKAFIIEKSNFLTQEPAQASPVVAYNWPQEPVAKKSANINTETKDYSPWKYLIPKYWAPNFYNVNEGYVFEGSTVTKDPLAKHILSLTGGYDTITEQPSYNVGYQNTSTELDLSASYSVTHEPLSGTKNYYKQTTGFLGTQFFIPGLSNNWRGALSAKYYLTEQYLFPDDSTKLLGPSAILNYSRTTDFGRQLKTGFINFSLSHSHYIGDKDFIPIDLTRLNLVYNFNHFLPTRHNLVFRASGSLSDNLKDNGKQNNNDVITYGSKTLGGNYTSSLIDSSIVMRGYSTGAFTAKQLAVGSFSYGFPILETIYRGPGTFPLFFKSIRANIFTDAISLKGRYLNNTADDSTYEYSKTSWDKVFVGSGAEIKLNTTIGYHLPVDFIIGGYYGFDEAATGGFSTFFTFSFSGIDSILNH